MLHYPYPLQAEIVQHPARWKVVATGRRSGKTTLGIYTLAKMMEYREMLCWWVAPTNQASFLAWERCRTVLGAAATTIDVTRKRLVLPNGSAAWFKSAEQPDNLRGEGIDALTLDEAAYIRNLDYLWSGVLRPMLIDTRGTMAAYSTPNRRNAFYRWFQRGQDDLQSEWMSWNFPTTANPHLPADELAKMIEQYPPGSELYRQEILGEFLEGSGAVFRKIREAIVTGLSEAKPVEGRRYVAGIDWGKSHDFTVSTIIDVADMTVVDIERFNIVDYHVQRDRIKAQWERWGVGFGLAEINAMGDPNYEELIRDGLSVYPFTTTAQSKRQIIESLAQAFELGTIGIPDNPTLIAELEAYERKQNTITGASTYSAPSGMHDDMVISLAVAHNAANYSGPSIAYVED